MKKTKLRVKGISTTAELKRDIQALVREIVIIRDGGCILRDKRCHVTARVENNKVISDTVIQADHLVTRANSATFADTRLIVCICKGCHAWKHWNEKEYDNLVKTVLPKDRLELWEKAEKDHQAHTGQRSRRIQGPVPSPGTCDRL
jgi:hypothetical protein